MLKGSIIFYNSNKNFEAQKLEEVKKLYKAEQKDNADFKHINLKEDKKSIGIDQMKEGIKWLNEKPFSLPVKILFVHNAEKITTDGQNTLLKILEELPGYASIFLFTKTLDALLPTIQSRCRKVDCARETKHTTEKGTTEDSFSTLMSKTEGNRLDWAISKGKEEKEEVIEVLESWLSEIRNSYKSIGSGNPESVTHNLELILEVKKNLENTNVNLKISLEYLVLHLI